MKSNKFRRIIAWPIFALQVLVFYLIQGVGFLVVCFGAVFLGPLEWLYFFISGTHYCGGTYQNWPQKYCKLCHYPSNPLGKYPERIERTPYDFPGPDDDDDDDDDGIIGIGAGGGI